MKGKVFVSVVTDVFLHGLILAYKRLLGFDVGCQSLAADETD
jgi:hypothetical protein